MKGEGFSGKGLIIASVVFILIVGTIFFAISGGLFGGNGNADERATVTDIIEGRSVRMTVEGPIVGEERRESYRIEVGTNERTIEALQGYQAAVLSAQTFTNNRPAYTEFAYALSRAGFDDRRNVSDEAADERGVCAEGKVYIFELLDDGRTLSRAWTSSCSNAKGTLGTSYNDLKQLFDAQIDDRTRLLGDIRLR